MKVGQNRSNYLPFHFAVPAPTSVMLSSSIPNPIPPFGSDVTLTCAVELSPAVDVPVTVNTVLTTDEGFMICILALHSQLWEAVLIIPLHS